MSQGGVFRLVLRDERVDKLFTASDYLRARLKKIRAKRAKAGYKNLQPTFTDIAKSHQFYLKNVYRPFIATACEYMKVKPSGDGTAFISPSGGSVQFTFPIFGHFTSDMVFNVRFKAVGKINGDLRFRYCAFPGMRLFKKVEFKSEGILIDDYTRDDVAYYEKFHVRADHHHGWLRGHGQQETKQAEFLTPNQVTGVLLFKDGAQTPKTVQPEFDLWVPLHLWMNYDAGNALLNDLIPNTQRIITAELAPLGEMIKAFNAQDEEVPLPFNKLKIELSLYINNLWVNPEIHDIFSSRIGFSLIRVHRRQIVPLNKESDSIKLDQLKFPAEHLYVGFRDRKNAADFDHWHLLGRRPERPPGKELLAPAMVFNEQLNVCQLVCRKAKISPTSTLDPIVNQLKVIAHGVVLYKLLPVSFYNYYLPSRYSESTGVVSPIDSSALLILFNLYPGKFSPSGYYNLSAGRELFLDYKSKDIDINNPAELVVTMSALNFLIRKGDKVSLRYHL